MAKKKDFSAFDTTSGISSFLSQDTKNASEQLSTMGETQFISTDNEIPAPKDRDGVSLANSSLSEQSAPRKGRPRQYKNTAGEAVSRSEKITIYLTPEQNQMIDYISRVRGVSKSKLLTDIVDKEMKKPEYRRAYDAMMALQSQL